ncbi:Uncharacterised protein [Vibrio cholerae]|nr:Uncharacterised protein [Vibrio cholerae]
METLSDNPTYNMLVLQLKHEQNAKEIENHKHLILMD